MPSFRDCVDGLIREQAYAEAVDAMLEQVTDWACRELVQACVSSHAGKEADV
jgi:hypothetical protein